MPELRSAPKQTAPQTVGPARPSAGGAFIVALAAMIVAIAVMFHPVLFGGRTTVISAANWSSVMPAGAYDSKSIIHKAAIRSPDQLAQAAQTEPWLKYTGWSFWHDHKFPLWNPYSGCGMPFIANMQSQVFSPPTFITSSFASLIAVDCLVLSRLLMAGLCAFFAFRMLMPTGLAALVGAVGYMFTGYMLLYLNMPELSVAMMVPALLLGIEAQVRKPGVGSFSLSACAVALSLFGGMPEETFVALVFAGCYTLMRLSLLDGWRLKLRTLWSIGCAYLAGLMLALPQVLPFLEYMKSSYNLHDPALSGKVPGMDFDQDLRRELFSYIFPVGWGLKCFARGFYGAAFGFLALMGAAVAGWTLLKNKAERTTCSIMLFLAAAFAVLLLKRFGNPLIQWIGLLPLANMVWFPKYDEPIMATCIAALAAYGVYVVQQRTVKPKGVLAIALTFAGLIGLLFVFYRSGPMISGFDLQRDMRHNMHLGLSMLAVSAVLCLLSFKSERMRKLLPLLVLLPVLSETYFGFMSQTFYAKDGLAPRALDPYSGAPYIEFLKGKDVQVGARVLGVDGVLYPNWSSAFNILDVRCYDALYPTGYNTFIAKLLGHPEVAAGGQQEQHYWFGGTEYWTKRPLSEVQRLCALTSTKYVIAPVPINSRIDFIVANAPTDPVYSSAASICYVPGATIDGAERDVLFQRPQKVLSKCAVKFGVTVPESQSTLEFDFIRNPDKACPPRDVSVEGVVLVSSVDESIPPEHFTFSNSEPAKLHATHYRVDLKRLAGKKVTVCLAARPTPGNECDWEWVGWSGMRFNEAVGERCVYDKEVKIYELPAVLPHASLFSRPVLVDTDEEALALLRERTFSPLSSLVISKRDLSEQARAALLSLDGGNDCIAAQISRYDSDQVVVDVAAKRQSLLLLTDIFYPGWRAYVDGIEAPVLRANFCFRAVLVPAGARQVVFRYDPWSFKIGVAASLLTLLGLAGWAIASLRNRRRARLEPEVVRR